MRAVTVRGGDERRLALEAAPEPEVAGFGLLVRVRAFSLNRGEVHGALHSDLDGARPGWDFAGEVVEAPEGSGFSPGDRVAGLCPSGAWAERIVVPPFLAARLPDGLEFETAACLPVAGLTAALSLAKGGALLGKRVLVTGATGGVGLMAVQLAALAGARVSALARDPGAHDLLHRLGAETVDDLEALEAGRPAFDLVVEAVGGQVLGRVLSGWLASGGVCVSCGNAGGDQTTFDSLSFRTRPGEGYGGTTLYGFFLGEELGRTPPEPSLSALAEQAAAGALDPVIRARADWRETDRLARELLDRRFVGKAVLTVS